ncbi:hypothetical protein BDB01DRAFT_834519 [Pilobolus umbonatus]|nr:hypothetical protein BDB01DRAFT_834519 [Pilobolus umbonatus]
MHRQQQNRQSSYKISTRHLAKAEGSYIYSKSSNEEDGCAAEAEKLELVEHRRNACLKDYFDSSEQSIFQFDEPFPSDLLEVILKLKRKTSFRDIYTDMEICDCRYCRSPREVLATTEYSHCYLLMDSPETEQDLLDSVYGFIKGSSRSSGMTAYGQ